MARYNETEDIPLAKRVTPYKSFDLWKVKGSLKFGFFFGVVLIIVSLNIFSDSKLLRKFFLVEATNSDGSLLGHYPYQEALQEDLVEVYKGLEVHKDVYKEYMSMKKKASLEGIDLILLSGYRSIDLQRNIFYENKSIRNQIAIERARVSAPPGYSEHSTGYAIDIGDGSMRETDFEVTFESTPAFKWMIRNAPKYHFILSFPKNNKQGVSYEPWHWRFEGTVEALKQFESANKIRRSR